MEKINQILELVDSLTILELKDLVSALEEKYGVSEGQLFNDSIWEDRKK